MLTGLVLNIFICKILHISSITHIMKCHCANDVKIKRIENTTHELNRLLNHVIIIYYLIIVERRENKPRANKLKINTLVHGLNFYFVT